MGMTAVENFEGWKSGGLSHACADVPLARVRAIDWEISTYAYGRRKRGDRVPDSGGHDSLIRRAGWTEHQKGDCCPVLQIFGRAGSGVPLSYPHTLTQRLSQVTSNLLKPVTPIPHLHHSTQISSLPIPSVLTHLHLPFLLPHSCLFLPHPLSLS
jgi:hypothetical protein